MLAHHYDRRDGQFTLSSFTCISLLVTGVVIGMASSSSGRPVKLDAEPGAVGGSTVSLLAWGLKYCLLEAIDLLLLC